MTREKRSKKHRSDAWRVGKTAWRVDKNMLWGGKIYLLNVSKYTFLLIGNENTGIDTGIWSHRIKDLRLSDKLDTGTGTHQNQYPLSSTSLMTRNIH